MRNKEKDILVNTYQFSEFTKSMSELCFDRSIDKVRNTDFTTNEIKSMTVDIMTKVSEKKDTELMNSITVMVEKWKNDKTKMWRKAVISFAKERQDVCSVNAVTTYDEKLEVVLVVDDTTKEHILDYNDFLFEIREKYDSVKDFMVIDESMISALYSMYKCVETIFKRG